MRAGALVLVVALAGPPVLAGTRARAAQPSVETTPPPPPHATVSPTPPPPLEEEPPPSPPAIAEPPPLPPLPPGTVIRPVRFTGTIGVISLPRLLSLELLARFVRSHDPSSDRFAVGAGIEYLPPGLASFGEETTLSWFQVGADGRYFVYRWLFVGGRVGYQVSRADSRKFGSEVDYSTRSVFFGPKVGALYTFESGFTAAAELGASIPMFAETTLYSDGTQDSNARKVSKTFGMFVMPFLSVRVGWTI